MNNWFSYLKTGLNRQMPKDPLAGKRTSRRANLEKLRPFLKRHWRKGILGTVLVFVTGLLALAQPLITRYLVDDVVLAKRMDLLVLAALLLAGVKVFEMGSKALEQYIFARFEQDILVDIQGSLLEHALRLPKAFFDDKEVGYLMSRLVSDVQGLRWFFSSTIAYLASSVFSFVGGVVFLFYLEWRLAIVTVIVLPVLVITARFFSKKMHTLSHHGMEQNATVFQRFEETLASIPLVKAYVAEKRESDRVINELQSARKISMEQTVIGSLASLAINIVPYLARGVVLVAGAFWVIRGEWTLGSLFAFLAYLSYVYGPALSLANANLQLQNALTALERVSAIFEILPEETHGTGRVVQHLLGDVRFEAVDFSYNGEERVLDGIYFHIQPGEHVVIAGPSGVGKTTLVSLLLQFYRPTRGTIFLDGSPATEYDLNSLRGRIGYVSQSSILLAGTIRKNLCYGNPEATQDEVDQAIETAGIKDFILGLPGGLEAPIGERGVNLSDGQKQRLSIARALIKNPDILILDEPTSALDVLTEESIFDALPHVVHEKTMIIITHRLSTIKRADRILIVRDGHIQAMGTHKALLESDPYYHSLFEH
jgi:ABC-type multidrug transport system fused ATPase/permease subunit